jgi:hypothetical protein
MTLLIKPPFAVAQPSFTQIARQKKAKTLEKSAFFFCREGPLEYTRDR